MAKVQKGREDKDTGEGRRFLRVFPSLSCLLNGKVERTFLSIKNMSAAFAFGLAASRCKQFWPLNE